MSITSASKLLIPYDASIRAKKSFWNNLQKVENNIKKVELAGTRKATKSRLDTGSFISKSLIGLSKKIVELYQQKYNLYKELLSSTPTSIIAEKTQAAKETLIKKEKKSQELENLYIKKLIDPSYDNNRVITERNNKDFQERVKNFKTEDEQLAAELIKQFENELRKNQGTLSDEEIKAKVGARKKEIDKGLWATREKAKTKLSQQANARIKDEKNLLKNEIDFLTIKPENRCLIARNQEGPIEIIDKSNQMDLS